MSKHTLDVDGMSCSSCALRVEKKLNRIDGVTATVNYATEKASVEAPTGVDVQTLIDTVDATGYSATRARRRRRASTPTAGCTASSRSAAACGSASRSPSRSRCCRWCRRCSSTAGSGSPSCWPPRSPCGAPTRSTGRLALNARHGAATMDTLISLGVSAAYLWSPVGAVPRRRRPHRHDDGLVVDRGRGRRDLPRGRQRGHGVHPGRPLPRGQRQDASPAPRCGP